MQFVRSHASRTGPQDIELPSIGQRGVGSCAGGSWVHRVPSVRFLLQFVRAPLSSSSQNSCEQTTRSACPSLIACRLCVGNPTRALSPRFCLSFVTRQ